MIGRLLGAVFRRLAPISHARAIGVTLGEGCRLIDVGFGSEPYLVTLGNRVSATATRFETHDGGVWVLRERHPRLDRIAPLARYGERALADGQMTKHLDARAKRAWLRAHFSRSGGEP